MAKPSDNVTDEIKKIFDKFDKNSDGKISCSELIENLGELGTLVSQEDVVHSIIKDFDKDGDAHLDIHEFSDLVLNRAGGTGTHDSLKDAFDLYDSDNNGLISIQELHTVMNKLGMKCSMEDCEKMIRKVDQDGDGHVDFEEFKTMMSRGFA